MPKKPKADTSWITDDLINALAFRESSMNPNAVNKESGASGLYGWMPAYFDKGLEVGFGVDKGPFDPFDPVESRKRTRQYLEGLQKYYPEWDPTEVLTAYNWGHSNVKKFREGTWEGDIESRAFKEAMNYAPLIYKHMKEQPYKDLLYRLGEPEQIQDLLDRGEPSTYMLLDEDPFASTI